MNACPLINRLPRRNPLLVWLAVAISLESVFAPASMASEPRELRAQMDEALQDNGLVGVVWATVTAGGAIEVGAAGRRDARYDEPLHSNDRVHIGSVAKTLLAAGVLRLVTEGRLNLDAPAGTLLPSVAFDNPWSASDPITVRHLLDHTAGLDDARLWQIFSLRPKADTPLLETFAGDASLLRVRSRPGSRFSYSNMSYALLGMVIESVTGDHYERYLDAHLLQPLGMHDSTFAFVSQADDQRLAMGHFEDGATQVAVPTYLRPATQFTTTARDMALFSRFLLSDGRVNGATLIDVDLLHAMGQPVGTEASQAGLPAGYALGLARRDRHGVVGRCHEGNTVGYRAMLCIFPEQQKAFFVALNADSETADYERFDALLIEALEVRAAAQARPQSPSAELATWRGFYVPAPNRFASFEWLDTALNTIHVRWDGTHLRLQALFSAPRLLVPEHDSLLRATDRATTSHVLLRTRDGRRVISNGFQTHEQASAFKIIGLWVSLGLGAAGLLYLYVRGIATLLLRRLTAMQPVLAPFVGVAALLIPLPLFMRQSFLELGDVTLATATLAIVTAVLPAAMLTGLVAQLIRGRPRGIAVIDAAAMLGVLQWTIVLAAYGLIPMRLWA